MPDLPTGTVTFFFSDIEGSTRLLQACGARWPELLARHAELIREALGRHDGVEVSTEGDSFFAAFGGAHAALAAAVEIQRALVAEPWPEEAEVRVRIGLHTGEATRVADDYVGLDVHRAARIMASGHGGQTVLSDATAALVHEKPVDGVQLVDLGEHQLRDLPAPERLWMAVAEGLPSEFPPLRGVTVNPTNLPIQLTSFVGRERETEALLGLVRAHRIVTLIGPGGAGKTRLALHVAETASADFAGGVYFVPLAEIREVELVLPTIGQVIGVAEPGRRPLERIPEQIAGRRVLLVLDNLEQVVQAAPDLSELVKRAPDLSLLITSRAPLRVYGETEFLVPPLSLPDPSRASDPSEIEASPAVALFVERARAVRPDFAVTAENARAIAELCLKLDGLPLAIELAAARVRILSPQAIVARLEQRLDLGGGDMARDRPERQQTLRGAIAWSHDLLDEDDRRFFAGFAVFSGGADLEAIEAVVMGGQDPLDRVASLLDKSLLRREETADGSVRFRMLETIREYAVERLEESGMADELRERHAAWFLGLAERAQPVIMGPEKRRWLDLLSLEHDNLRAAHARAIERGDAQYAMRLVAALWRFWQMRGHLVEGLARTRAALELPDAESHPEALARALDAAGGLAYWMADGTTAGAFYQRKLELERELGNKAGEAWALYSLAFTELYYGASAEEAFDPERTKIALDYINQAVEVYREIGDRSGLALALWGKANVIWAMGLAADSPEVETALAHAREALDTFEAIGDQFMVGWSSYTVGIAEMYRGNLAPAGAALVRALRLFHEAGDVTGYVLVLDALAAHAQRLGNLERAARLSGAVSVLERQTGTGLNPPNRRIIGFDPRALRSDPALAAAWAEGEQMTIDETIARAVETEGA